jgi:hypothetical protein
VKNGTGEQFDIRGLIRRCVRESPSSSDPAMIARTVAEKIPEEHLREVVAQWLPRQVDTEMFNMHAEKIARGG